MTESMRGTNRRLVFAAVMVATFLTAMDVMVVGTAMPTIIGQLGGLPLYSWVFSAYLLSATVTVPIYGKLADLYGRKPVFVVGTSLFLLGSALCGTARSMEELIVFRALQGLGAGAVQPITLTIIGDIFTLEERARYTGIFSGVWGVASLIGPAVGGFLTDYVDWRWVFYINLPIGLLAMALLTVTLHERVERRRHAIDVVGAALLTGGISALMFALLIGGREQPWTAPQVLGLFGAAALCLALFVVQEARAPEPMVPLDLFRSRIIAVASVGALLGGMAMFGINSFVPPFVQGVMGGSATNAGLVLTALSIGWPIGSIVAGRVLLRLGYRATGLTGMVAISLGTFFLTRLDPAMGQQAVLGIMALIGLGLGFATLTFTLSVQNAVPWSRRGVATASNQFFRTIGGTVGVSLAGAVFATQAASYLVGLPGALGLQDANALLDPAARASLPPEALPALIRALDAALHDVYTYLLGVTLAGVVAALLLPGARAEEHVWRPPDAAAAEPVGARQQR